MGERDFLRWISANDALLAIAALAMMQRKEERGERKGRPSIIYHAAIICLGGCGERGRGSKREGDGDGWSGLKGFELLTTSY